MIIKRQKLFSKKKKGESILLTQPGDRALDDVIYQDSKKLNPHTKEYVGAYDKLIDKQLASKKFQKAMKEGGVKVDGKDIFIRQLQGKEINTSNPRSVANVFMSDKSPKEAYRDWLKTMDQRLKLGDFNPSDPSMTNKEIKEAIRREIKKRNIKTASIGLGIGALATAGTAMGVKAYKKKKNKDK